MGDSPSDDDDDGDDGADGDDGGADDGEEDTRVRRLMRAWVAERAAPSVLRWEGDIVDDLMHKVEQQTDMVTLLLSEASTSEEEHFKLMLVQTEIERVKFLIRAYLRTRLSKIERFAQHISSTPAMHYLLSPLELSHAKRYNALLIAHYKSSVLNSLPPSLHSLTELHNDGTDMVSKPNSKTPVFIYCKKDIGPARLPSGQDADFAKGTTHLVRWGMVEGWVREGRAELI
ncbi:hypothetical protein BDY24DRAFT_338614 [Mrakia frigida]|uniref:DNA replication protein SLD5 n=1 Tax=Mrakia frigida TaxID=29902 RepID=UPI003FCC1435